MITDQAAGSSLPQPFLIRIKKESEQVGLYWRRIAALQLLLIVFVLLTAFALLDSVFPLSASIRVSILILAFVAAMLRLVMILRLPDPSLNWSARKLELDFPDLDNALINAVQFSRLNDESSRHSSQEFRELEIERANRLAQDIAPSHAPGFPVKNILIGLFLACVIILPAREFWKCELSRLLLPWRDLPAYSQTTFLVDPDRPVVRTGEGITLHVRAEGRHPQAVSLEFKAQDGSTNELPMNSDKPGNWQIRLESIEKPLSVRVSADTGKSGWIPVTVLSDVSALTSSGASLEISLKTLLPQVKDSLQRSDPNKLTSLSRQIKQKSDALKKDSALSRAAQQLADALAKLGDVQRQQSSRKTAHSWVVRLHRQVQAQGAVSHSLGRLQALLDKPGSLEEAMRHPELLAGPHTKRPGLKLPAKNVPGGTASAVTGGTEAQNKPGTNANGNASGSKKATGHSVIGHNQNQVRSAAPDYGRAGTETTPSGTRRGGEKVYGEESDVPPEYRRLVSDYFRSVAAGH